MEKAKGVLKMSLQISNVEYSYGSKKVLNGINLSVDSNLTALIGPNAAGKSTLLKCVAGILKAKGSLLLDGKDVSYTGDWETRKAISYLPQEAPDRTVLTVMEIILLGRLDSLTWKVSDEDINLAYKVMEDLDITHISTRSMNELSGGQQQIVSIAQALVRQPRLLLLDEPTNNLDLQKQLEMFELIKGITVKNHVTTLAVLHDINFAARYADNIVILSDGKIYASGLPADVIKEDIIKTVYGVNSTVSFTSEGIPQVYPISSVRNLPWSTNNAVSLNQPCLVKTQKV
jgi:iron complex transport system ATP-binding protein